MDKAALEDLIGRGKEGSSRTSPSAHACEQAATEAQNLELRGLRMAHEVLECLDEVGEDTPERIRDALAAVRDALGDRCPHPDHDFYPYYGVAPHECFYKKGPGHTVGQSTLLPRDAWPDNFVLDLEPGETLETVQYPNACGVYYCPDCKAGMPQQATQDGSSPKSSKQADVG